MSHIKYFWEYTLTRCQTAFWLVLEMMTVIDCKFRAKQIHLSFSCVSRCSVVGCPLCLTVSLHVSHNKMAPLRACRIQHSTPIFLTVFGAPFGVFAANCATTGLTVCTVCYVPVMYWKCNCGRSLSTKYEVNKKSQIIQKQNIKVLAFDLQWKKTYLRF